MPEKDKDLYSNAVQNGKVQETDEGSEEMEELQCEDGVIRK